MAVDHFERLGLPRRFALSAPDIEESYLTRSRSLHPDVHQLSTSNERQLSLEMSAALNEAYASLKEPLRRAEYLLQLEGGPSASASKEVDPAFLEEMLELRMEIEEIRESADPDAVSAMENRLRSRRETLLQQIGVLFGDLGKPGVSDGRVAILRNIRQHLTSARYIQGLWRDLRADD